MAHSGGQELRPAEIDLGRLVTAIEPTLRRLLGDRIELVVSATPGVWPIVADRSQVEAILVNLAVNARDAMIEGGRLTVETANAHVDDRNRRHHAEVTPGQYAVVTVTDSGVAIDAVNLAHLAEPSSATDPPGSGRRLGLATVYATVRQSGGHVRISSGSDRGNSFTIYLPRSTQTGGVEEQRPSLTPGVKPRHETILVAEDEAVVRDMVVASLERLGYQVMVASTGEEAVRLIDRLGDDIDLLLSDVVMPGMSGPDLLDRARRTRPELRAVFMTGYTALSVGRPIPAGVTLLEKPFSSTRLGEVVRAVLAAG